MKKFGSIKLGVPDTLNFEGRNYPVKTDTGKISKRKGKPSIKLIEDDADTEPEVKRQPVNRKWGTAEVEVPNVVSYRNSAVDTVKEGDLTIRNKEPSIQLITRGERLEVLDKGKQEKVISHFLKMLSDAPLPAVDKANIRGEFVKTIKEKGIREGLKHLLDVIKEIQKMDEDDRKPAPNFDEERKMIKDTEDILGNMRGQIDELRRGDKRQSNIEKGREKLSKFTAKKEAMIQKGRDKFADLKGMGSDEFRLVIPPNEREPFEDDAFFQPFI
jgi:hypothetical protein